MSHICPRDDRLSAKTEWCKTLGVCELCGGLICRHGCQREQWHGRGHWIRGPRHAAPPWGSAAREAAASPYIGRRRD